MRAFSVRFDEKNLTGNAGLTHFGKFIKKLGILKLVEEHVHIQRGANAEYRISEIVVITMLGVFSGAKHISHLKTLKNDFVLRKIFKWVAFPVTSTFGRIFKLFKWSNCVELSKVEDIARRKVWKKKWFGRITLDFDSSVKGVFGNQEGARVGYNPKKKGQKSYHPLFCFIAETYECLHNWFRSGDAYTSNGVVEFTKECIEKIPKRVWKIRVRGDSGFFGGDFLSYLESISAEYCIKVKLKGLNVLLSGKKWRKIRSFPGFESTEFLYQCNGWKDSRRFVAVRFLKNVKTDGLLFPQYEYEYFCYVTNMGLTPMGTHKFYKKRATSENWIEWCKNQMAAGNILTDDFWANSAIFQTCILAYNVMVWMMRLTDSKGYHEEPDTIRFWLIHVPGRLLTGNGQLVLKLSKNYVYKERWKRIDQGIEILDFA